MNEAARKWGALPGYELTEWRKAFGVIAGTTDRSTDFELPERGIPSAFVELHRSFEPSFEQVVVSRQVHGAAVSAQRKGAGPLRRLEGLDGHLTDERALLLAVTVADCVPVYLVHPDSGAVGLLHAGWRGVATGIVEAGVRGFVGKTGGLASAIVMHCGVSICGDCYEVGAEVFEALGLCGPGDRGRIDLRAHVEERARRLGVGRVTVSRWCTAHHNDRFHSHRASAGADGRQVAFIGRPQP